MGSLKTKHYYPVLLGLFCLLVKGQNLELPYSAAGMIWYSNHLYCFGLEEKPKALQFTIQQVDKNLVKKEEKSYLIPVQTTEEKVACWSDTLHGLLNVYVSEGRNQKVSVFRFNKKFELLYQTSGVEVGRLNSLSGFDNELYYEGASVYAIKTKSDSSGKQFYLNKYVYNEGAGGFEYNLIWQFPFERKNISSARVFYANPEVVIMYVMVKAGEKTGQWILKVSAKNGYLVKGTKLNAQGDESAYCFGNYYFDSGSKNLLVLGQKFSSKQLTANSEILSIAGSTAVSLYLSEIDSLGNQVVKQEIRLPIVQTKIAGKAPGLSYILQINKVSKTASNQYKLEADVYKNLKTSACYTFANSFKLLLTKEEETFLCEKKNITSDPLIETYLFSNDKLDMNGKLCLDSGTSVPKLFYKQPSLNVKVYFGEDSLGRPLWILNKRHVKKESINYTLLQAGKKTYELSVLEDIQKSKAPTCIPLPNNRLVLGRQTEPGVYKLVLYKY